MKIATSSTRSISVGGSSPVENSQEMETHSPLYTGSMILVAIVMTTSMAAIIYAQLPKMIKLSFSPKLPATFPCQQCHYFSHNPYIKCTLHPDRVLTDLAIDCRDYSEQINK